LDKKKELSAERLRNATFFSSLANLTVSSEELAHNAAWGREGEKLVCANIKGK